MASLEEEIKQVSKDLKVENSLIGRLGGKIKDADMPWDEKKVLVEHFQNFKNLANREKYILSNLEKGNKKEVLNHFHSLVQDHQEFPHREFYELLVENDILDKQTASEIFELEKEVGEIEEDLLERVKKRREETKKEAYRPTVYIQENVAKPIFEAIREIQIGEDREFAALLHYQRNQDGILIDDYEILSDETAKGRREGVSHSEELKKRLQKSTQEKIIYFHSHPPAEYQIKPSERDVSFFRRSKLGIGVTGYAAPEFMQSEVDCGLFAFIAKPENFEEFSDSVYLPIKIVRNGKEVTQNYPQILAYNESIGTTRPNRYDADNRRGYGLSIADAMKDWWKENM